MRSDMRPAKQHSISIRCLWVLIALMSVAPVLAGAPLESQTMPDPRTQEAVALMMDFAQRTGLVSDRPGKRYLWTDAFAVCNFLGLARSTGQRRYTELALQLVEQVHHTLGRHRDDDPRSGWISGLSEPEGEMHPTRGGLRIGKMLPERSPQQPFDERLEWERDGQYFHYLTKWMHALDQVTRWTRQARFNLWARELADASFRTFTYLPSSGWGPRRMYWKVSIDGSRALVPSMGQHDPLDGYTTFVQLQSTAVSLTEAASGPDLAEHTDQFAGMLKHGEWVTADPLGLGGLLIDAYRLQQLLQQGATADAQLLDTLLSAALRGLQHFARSGELQLPAEHRLAFRELGLVIGLHAVERMWQTAHGKTRPPGLGSGAGNRLEALMRYKPMRDEIESYWRVPEAQRTHTWSEHLDINTVMLATCLAPDGFLVLPPPAGMK